MSYLHPSQRAAAAQIGPSGHENNYHVGVLQGNWFEERHSFGPQPSSNFKFTATTEAQNAYGGPTADQLRSSKPPAVASQEAPRSLLLGQGKPVTSMRSVAELSYTDTIGGTRPVRTTHEVLNTEGHSPRVTGTIGKRVENGTMSAEAAMAASRAARAAAASGQQQQQGDGDDGGVNGAAADAPPAYLRNAKAEAHFLTTKNVTHDAAAEYAMENPQAYTKGKCSSRGLTMRALDDPMAQTGLRK